ncbi:MAG: hypothetical protein SOX86_03640 [Bacilli bacterium]|nr:hypothetical protein [Bacilli bacterium]
MKNEEMNSIINTNDKEAKNNEVNNTSSDNLSQKEFKTNERKITKEPRSILKFYRDNKSIITLNEEDFKAWLSINYFAERYDRKFIATYETVENGYMINSKKAIIDLEKLTCDISYNALITPKGQNYILDYFEGVQNEREN